MGNSVCVCVCVCVCVLQCMFRSVCRCSGTCALTLLVSLFSILAPFLCCLLLLLLSGGGDRNSGRVSTPRCARDDGGQQSFLGVGWGDVLVFAITSIKGAIAV